MKVIAFISVLLASFAFSTQAQLSFDDVDYQEIPFRKVRKYLDQQRERAQIDHFMQLERSCRSDDDFSGFFKYKRRYVIKAPIEDVWDTYKNASPTEAWTTRKSSCGLMYQRENDAIYYPTEKTEGINPGQVLYMDLKLIKGLYHLATSFEITRVEDEAGVIEVTYTGSGINRGKQVIEMAETEKGYTVVSHSSMILSGSNFRDRYLYPYFHNRLINAFHRKMRRMVYRGDLLDSEVL